MSAPAVDLADGGHMGPHSCEREHLERFYSILDLMSRRRGFRTLAECAGSMQWPSRGVYFFFDPGERRALPNGAVMRVVRVGTHAVSTGSRTTLWDRLRAHRGTGSPGGPSNGGNHRGSIFRRHVGAALLRAGRYAGEGADSWGVGSSAPPHVTVREIALERAVSAYIGRLPFLWVEADDDPGPESVRAYLEQNSIALLSRAIAIDPPSAGWLGRHASDEAIRASGLWNVRHVAESYVPAFLDVLERCATAPSCGARPPVAVRAEAPVTPASPRPAPTAAARESASTLALVSCTKLKASSPCRAADLYRPSTFFRLAYAYASREAARTMILSAKYGLLRPDTTVAPYEQTLATASWAERKEWAARVHAQLRDSPEYRDATSVLWLAGESYRAALLPLVQQDGKECFVPMEGLAQGKQLSWLNRQLAGSEPRVAIESAPRPSVSGVDAVKRSATAASSGAGNAPRAEDFRAELQRLITDARRESRSAVAISAGRLHRVVGGYPGPCHRMPICCRVMLGEMRAGDVVVAAPPSGQGASLEISYRTAR